MINLLRRRSVRAVMIGFLVMLTTSASWSRTTYDFTGLVTGGSFGTIGNWTPVGIPELMDTARFSLDQAIEFIAEDELIEVTPTNIRLRKMELDANKRASLKKKEIAI